MKKSHLFALVIVAATIGVIISSAGDASTYVCFRDAYQLSLDDNHKKVHVVGKLKKDHAGHIQGMHYDPVADPNHFQFVLVDNNQQEQTVVYTSPKPQDFERSEQIVIVGKMEEKVFHADKILMKCPSKYEDRELKDNLTAEK